MKKVIGFVSGDISRSGGTERVGTIIANGLSEKYKIIILTYGEKKDSYYFLNENIKILKINNSKNKYIKKISSIYNIRKILKKYNIEILIDIDTILSINSLLASFFLKTKVISWEHFNFYNDLNIKRRKWARKLAAKFSSQIITLTEEDKNYFIENLNINGKIDYIYNPSPYLNIEKKNKKNKIAISVGRLTKIKGFDKLIDIWKMIEEKDSDWVLYIIGDGEDKSKLLKQIETYKLKNIKLINHTKEIDKYYEEASIYLMTSRFEGLPMTLIEAQSFGVPIISYDIKTGPKDIVIDGKNGYLIENNNSDEFVKKFLELSKNFQRIEEFSDRAFEDSKRFNTSNILAKWEGVFEN